MSKEVRLSSRKNSLFTSSRCIILVFLLVAPQIPLNINGTAHPHDDISREFQKKLIEKAKENVKIYFLYDEIGSHKLPQSYLREMQIAGINTPAFHTTKGKANRFQLNFRNHRKIVVVDGKIAYVGGHNVGDAYLGKDPNFGAWRDTHVKVQGPVVQEIQFCFVEDWHWATNEIPELSWELQKAGDGREKILMIASGPADNLETCALMFVQVINDARQRVWIASPYFVPDLQILSALKLATRSARLIAPIL